jgi:hypothetical protein
MKPRTDPVSFTRPRFIHLAHELGHGQGLEHHIDMPWRVMNEAVNASSNEVLQSEASAYDD